ncbi:MAG: hypothetical protein ACJ8CR_33920 [Roseiflexaceae bacterium]
MRFQHPTRFPLPRHVYSWLLLFGGLLMFVQLLQNTRLWPLERVFAGYYLASFEISSFVACGSFAIPGYGQGSWLSAGPESQFYERYHALGSLKPDWSTPGPIVYVRFIGHLAPPQQGGYGHLGGYPREVVVSQLLSMAPDQAAIRIATLLLAAGIALCGGIMLPLIDVQGGRSIRRRSLLCAGLWLELLWFFMLFSIGCV